MTSPPNAPRKRRRSIPHSAAALAAVLAGVSLLATVGSPPEAGATTLLAGMAYVVNWGSNTVTPINTETDAAGTPIKVGVEPDAIAITPNGATAYVANWGSDTVTPIDLATGVAGKAIGVGLRPDAIAIPPDGATAYVANFDSASVTPIDIADNKAGSPIATGAKGAVSARAKELHPDAIAADPSNDLVYVASETSANLVAISTIDNKAVFTVPANADPRSIAVSPVSRTAYVANFAGSTLTPVNLSTGKAAALVALGAGTLARGVAITPDGTTAYVSDFAADAVTPVDLTTGQAGTPITVGTSPMGIAVTPDGTTTYVADSGSNQVTPIDTATGTAGSPIAVGTAPDAIAIVPSWDDQSHVASTSGTASTDDAPAIAYFQGELYALWTDATSGDEVMWSVFNGTAWTPAQQLVTTSGDALSRAGPSVAVAGGKLWAVWEGAAPSGFAYVWYSAFNGTSWSPQTKLSFTQTLVAPAVAPYGRDPIVAWVNGNDTVETSLATSSGSWGKPSIVKTSDGEPLITATPPALGYSGLNNLLFVAWTNGSGQVQYLVFNPVADSSSGEGTVPLAKTASSPAVTSTGEAVYIAWTGVTTNKIFYSGSWPLDTHFGDWAPQETEPQALTNESPALAVNGYNVTVAWKGLSTDQVGFATATTPY